MTALSEQRCVACRADTPKLSDRELTQLKSEVPLWSLVSDDGVMKLQRQFIFGDFATAMAFSQKIGEIAEAEDHHPAILTEWGKVSVTWWTHKIKGLHSNDFIMAYRTDTLLDGLG